MDLSASHTKDGLGAIVDEVTGFGVKATMGFLQSMV
jgi:hypothetical protein